MSIRQKKLPIAALERIDDQCAEFERLWQIGKSPSIESFLVSATSISEDVTETERETLLAELIVLDIDYRRRRGEKPSSEEYLKRFPKEQAAIQDVLVDDGKKATTFEPPAIEQLAKIFPSLEIIKLIGAGGMGAVYQARQKRLDRMVALKILPEEFCHDNKFALRFTREARTLAKLHHPNIVSVFEFGHVDETYYFLMEYVEGTTLREVERTHQLSPEQALGIVPDLCDALQYAHDKGVIHRDIKPENILLSTDGSVKIADFGLARILGNDSHQETLTGTHQVMGTLRYMAPEQLEGSHRVDHRADIYSLGVVIYEMLTGELPLGRFAAPSEKVEIDVRLDQVVLRTLEKEPQRRYQHASEIKADVSSITSDEQRAIAPTIISDKPNRDSSWQSSSSAKSSLEQQELAGRLLLTRRQLLERVETSLKPLFTGQIIQILFGVAIILIGVQCWARNTEILHRVISGAILHGYGLAMIITGAFTLSQIKRVDYSKPINEIRNRIDILRNGYLKTGMVIGLSWWLLWIPFCVAVGFDGVLHPYSLIPSLIVGVLGISVMGYFFVRAIYSTSPAAEAFRRKLSGNSIASAYRELDEIAQAQIQ